MVQVRQAARVYAVPESTLRDRLHSSFCAEKRANNHKLTRNEKESLVRWIFSMDRYGAAPRPAHIEEMANILLSKRGSANIQTVGVNWVYNFIRR